jgi:hypothetical protein
VSLYALQKAIRDINRKPDVRASFLATPEEALRSYSLSDEERQALVSRDYTQLYRMGVHGLLLRPFSLLHQVAEADYLAAIRKEG